MSDIFEIAFNYHIPSKSIVYFLNQYKIRNGIKKLHECQCINNKNPGWKKMETLLFLNSINLKDGQAQKIDKKTYKIIKNIVFSKESQ